VSRRAPDIPIVVASGIDYVEMQYYADAELRKRLVTVIDPEVAINLVGTNSIDMTSFISRNFLPLQIETRAEFLQTHPHFLMWSGGTFEWLPRYLLENGYRISLLSQHGRQAVYRVEQSVR
jgi:hypothetical protein